MYALAHFGLAKESAVGADGIATDLQQKYPGFPDRVHEGLQDIFGDKGR
jgi:hexokinase